MYIYLHMYTYLFIYVCVCVCVCVCVGLVALLQAKQAKQAKHTSAEEHVTAVVSTDLLRILCPAPRAMTSMLVCVFQHVWRAVARIPGPVCCCESALPVWAYYWLLEPVSACENPLPPSATQVKEKFLDFRTHTHIRRWMKFSESPGCALLPCSSSQLLSPMSRFSSPSP